jgi:hypothetical protein
MAMRPDTAVSASRARPRRRLTLETGKPERARQHARVHRRGAGLPAEDRVEIVGRARLCPPTALKIVSKSLRPSRTEYPARLSTAPTCRAAPGFQGQT